MGFSVLVSAVSSDTKTCTLEHQPDTIDAYGKATLDVKLNPTSSLRADTQVEIRLELEFVDQASGA